MSKKISGYMYQIESNLPYFKAYDFKDMLICSHAVFEELTHYMEQKPFDERSNIYPSIAIPQDEVYYVDEHGFAYKYRLEVD